MWLYVLRRLLVVPPLLLGVASLTFILVHSIPGDPIAIQYGINLSGMDAQTVERLREDLGLNAPLPVQYARYMGSLLRLDLGTSLSTKTPVSQEILQRFPATLELTLAGMLITVLTAVPLGVISALRRGTFVDRVCMLLGLLGVSMPAFWLGIMLIFLFALALGWLPSSGRSAETPAALMRSLALPAFTLGIVLMGIVTRVTRSSVLEILGQDFVRAARAKGVPGWRVIVRHALPNALIPVVTILGLQFASLLGGAVVIENVFAWPGLGRLALNAILRRDYPVIMGTVLVFAVTVILVNLLIDLLYTVLDPRIRFQ